MTSKAGQELLQNIKNTTEQPQTNGSATNVNNAENHKNGHEIVSDLLSHPSPVVSMVSKHTNGTLNLWQLTFADKTKFSQVKISNKL